MKIEHLEQLTFNDQGLIPAILQDYYTREILMMAWMNKESLEKTIDSGVATFFSRSRQKLWTKGETSGHFQHIVAIDFDCDGDALLVQVIPDGPACHTGHQSCFYRNLITDPAKATGNITILHELADQVADRRQNPVAGSYTNYLMNEGVDKICKKIGEEASETIIAAKNDDPAELTAESSDLIYHLAVLLNNQGVTFDDLFTLLTSRHQEKRGTNYDEHGKIK